MDFGDGRDGSIQDIRDKGVVERYGVSILWIPREGFIVGYLRRGAVGGVGQGCYVGFARAGSEVEGCLSTGVSYCWDELMGG